MYKKVAVCLDGSELAEQVLPYAAEVAQRFGGSIVLLRVVSQPVIMAPGIPGASGMPVVTAGMQKRVEDAERDAEAYLRPLADRLLKDYQLQAECVTTIGDAGRTIVDYAAGNGVELIAIATHGRSGPGRVLFGSVADFVVRHSKLPLLLIRPNTAPG
jgi:nucleotide-binding universal stress UspA family protein